MTGSQESPSQQPLSAPETNEQLRLRVPQNPGESETDYHARLEAERTAAAATQAPPEPAVDDPNA